MLWCFKEGLKRHVQVQMHLVGSTPTMTTELKRSSEPPTRDRIPVHAWIVRGNTLEGTRPRDGARLNGKMAEWLNAPVLKTGNCNRFWGSNPCLSAKLYLYVIRLLHCLYYLLFLSVK